MNVVVILILLALILVPGLGATLAIYAPGRLTLPTRLALSFALGYALAGGSAFVLTLLSVLTPASFLIAVVVLTAAAWAFAIRRSGLREHARALAAEFRDDPWPLWVGLAVLAGIAVMRATFLDGFPTGSPFRYWIDGVEIADAGRIPSLTLHYGALWPPVTSKIFLNAFTAGAHNVTAGDMVGGIRAMLWIGAVGTAVGLWAVGRELGLRWMASLLPVLVMANAVILGHEITNDLSGYRGEVVGRMVAFCALPLGLRALRDGGTLRDAAVAAACLAAAAGTHLIAAIVAGIILFWYGIAHLLLHGDRLRLVRRVVRIGAIGGLLAAAVLLLPRGSIGFEGAANQERYRPSVTSFDKTFFLYTGNFRAPRSRAFYVAPAVVVRAYVQAALGAPPGSPVYSGAAIVVLALLAAAAAAAMARWFPGELRTIGIIGVGLAASLTLLSLGFDYLYDLYIPATFGVRRLFDYAALPVILVGLAFAERGLMLVRRWRTGVAVATVVVVSALLIPSARNMSDPDPGRRARASLSWIRQNIPCDARILANQRSLGGVRALTGRVAVLEGMGPFLRPQMLDVVVEQILGARRFFAAPEPNREYLVKHGVDYVVFLQGFLLGPGAVGRLGPSTLADVSFLEPVHLSPSMHVYRVVGLRSGGPFPDPNDHPAYDCRTEPIPG